MITYRICHKPPEDPVAQRLLVLDYAIYDRYRHSCPSIDCLDLYRSRKTSELWLTTFNRLLEHFENSEDPSRFCQADIWGILSPRYIYALMGLYEFLDHHGPIDAYLGPDLEPLLMEFFRDLIESHGGRCFPSKRVTSLFSSVFPAQYNLNPLLAKIVNRFGTMGKSGGILFCQPIASKDLFQLCLKKDGSVSLINPPVHLLTTIRKDNRFNFYFTTHYSRKNSLPIRDIPFSVGRANMTRSLNQLVQAVLKKQGTSYLQERDFLYQWVKKIQPYLIVLGATQNALSRMLCEIAEKLSIPTLHVPHGLYTLSQETTHLWGIRRSQGLVAYSEEINRFYQSRIQEGLQIYTSLTGPWISHQTQRLAPPIPTKTVMILEYGTSDGSLGESYYWYYQYVLDLMIAHRRRFPERKIILRLRPTQSHKTLRKKIEKVLFEESITKHLLKIAFTKNLDARRNQLDWWLEKQRNLIEFLNRHLPSGCFEIDNQANFSEALKKVNYVIGNFTTAFLEAMSSGIPYYCYNPAGINYPPPLDESKEYVNTQADTLVSRIDQVSFDQAFKDYYPSPEPEKRYADYQSAWRTLCLN